MTTEVIIKANHGWPVIATQLTVQGYPVGQPQRIEPGQEVRLCVHSGADLLVHEVQPDAPASEAPDHIMQFFDYGHLPEHLKMVSMPFGEVAKRIIATLPRNPERTVALRKLLEAKDAAVRAVVAKSA